MKVYKLITKKRTVRDNEIEEYYFEKMFTLDQCSALTEPLQEF